MTIKFIEDKIENPDNLTFKDVEINQFFVNDIGYLCQKAQGNAYIFIADNHQVPWGGWQSGIEKDCPIERVLPKIKKIEF